MTPSSRWSALALIAGLLITGCLGEPELEDRWTRIDLVTTGIDPGRPLAPGDSLPVALRAAITYRAIVTGGVVADLRASTTISPDDVSLDPDADRLTMAHDVARILAGSVSVGRAVRPVTGWTHLIQQVDLAFDAQVPAPDPTTGAGLFLVAYLADIEEMELPGGVDSLVVTPLDVDADEILPVGVSLDLSGYGAGS